MVEAISDRSNPHHHHHHHRPPLLPSDNGGGGGGVMSSRRPKSREVTSRYLSSSSSSSSSNSSASYNNTRRCPSPLVSRTSSSSAAMPSTPLPFLKRSQSAERRRPGTPKPAVVNNAGEFSEASKILITSTRSLSVSFQGESYSLPISKTKTKASTPQNLSSVRKTTPERRRTTPLRGGGGGGGGDQGENSKPIDQHRWPARMRQQPNPLSRSLDCTVEKKKLAGSGSVVRALQQSMNGEGRRMSFEGQLRMGSSKAVLVKSMQLSLDINGSSAMSAVLSDPVAWDTESVSSGTGSNSGVQDCGGVGRTRNGARGISVPARFWQETNSRVRRLHDPGSPLSITGSSRMAPAKLIPLKKSMMESPMQPPRSVTSSRGMSSPMRGQIRPASPSKLLTCSPARGNASPSRVRNAVTGPVSSQLSGMPSILSFPGRGKVGENQIMDAHMLRLLYNRHLQWRFVNARADAATFTQRQTAEKTLYNAWITTSELRDSVTVKRIKLQLLRQKLKITSILKGQMAYLEDWGLLDRDHSNFLSGAIEALKASTLRLPVGGGARGDVQNMKEAVSSAVDVVQAMGSSICSLLSKVEEVNTLVAELANVTSQEHALLDQGKDLLSTLAAMQVRDCSLRTHILQVKRVPKTTA